MMGKTQISFRADSNDFENIEKIRGRFPTLDTVSIQKLLSILLDMVADEETIIYLPNKTEKDMIGYLLTRIEGLQKRPESAIGWALAEGFRARAGRTGRREDTKEILGIVKRISQKLGIENDQF